MTAKSPVTYPIDDSAHWWIKKDPDGSRWLCNSDRTGYAPRCGNKLYEVTVISDIGCIDMIRQHEFRNYKR